MQGQLFTTDFLLRGICETDAWRALSDADLDAFIAGLKAQYATFAADSALNEAQTEDALIAPVLDLLGWEGAWISQVNLSLSGREDVPDFLLFADPAARERAYQVPDSARARHGIALMEAKRWLRALDRSEDGGDGQPQAARLRRPLVPDAALPVPRRCHERPRGEVGHPQQRRGLAAVLAGRPVPRRGLLRDRPGRVARCARRPAGPRRLRTAPWPQAVPVALRAGRLQSARLG